MSDRNDTPGITVREITAIALWWAIGLLAFALIRDCDKPAQAREVPPLIAPMPEAQRDARSTTDEPVDGPMCERPERIEGPAPTLLGVLLEDPATEAERAQVEAQIGGCIRDVRRVADPWLVLAVLRYEETLGVPDEARGILGAVWCIESAMRVEAARGGPVRGDIRNGRAMAHGPAQLWPWHRAWCGLTDAGADDLFAALGCYWQRVSERHEKRASGCAQSWRVAEALTANGPRYAPQGCTAQSGHWRQRAAWEE